MNILLLWAAVTLASQDPDPQIVSSIEIDGPCILSPDGQRIAEVVKGKALRLIDAKSGNELKSIPFAGISTEVESLTFSSDGTSIFGGTTNGHLMMWACASGTLLKDVTLSDDANPVNAGFNSIIVVSASADGKHVVGSGMFDGFVFEISKSKFIRPLAAQTTTNRSVTSIPGLDLAAFGSDDGRIVLLDIKSGKPVRILKGHLCGVHSLASTSDGKLLASGDGGPQVLKGKTDALPGIKIWDPKSGKELRSITVFSHRSLAFIHKSSLLVSEAPTSDSGRGVAIWDAATGKKVWERKDCAAPTVSADGRFLAVSEGKKVSVLRIFPEK